MAVMSVTRVTQFVLMRDSGHPEGSGPFIWDVPSATRDVSLHGSANDGTTSQQIEHALAHATHRGCCPVIWARSTSRLPGAATLGSPRRRGRSLVECWKGGHYRNDVMRRAGLSESAYGRARKRLLYLSRA